MTATYVDKKEQEWHAMAKRVDSESLPGYRDEDGVWHPTIGMPQSKRKVSWQGRKRIQELLEQDDLEPILYDLVADAEGYAEAFSASSAKIARLRSQRDVLLAAVEDTLVAIDPHKGRHSKCQYCEEPVSEWENEQQHGHGCPIPRLRAAIKNARVLRGLTLADVQPYLEDDPLEPMEWCEICSKAMPVSQMRVGSQGALICGTEPGSELALQCTSRMLARKDEH